MEQRKKNFILLLAALLCFSVGAVLFTGDDHVVVEQTDETQDENNTETTETEGTEEETVAATTVAEDDDFFENYRMQREQRRDAQIELYQEILDDDTRDEEAKTAAQTSLEKLYNVAATEDKVEEILIGRNYSDVIFIMEDSVSLLIIKKSSLDEEEKAALSAFVTAYTGISSDSLSVFTVD